MNAKKLISGILAGVIYFTSTLSAGVPDFNPSNPSASGGLVQSLVDKANILTIRSPKPKRITGSEVQAKLQLGTNLDRRTLQVILNGHDVSKKFVAGSCNSDGCQQTAQLTTADGLRSGGNFMRAFARTQNHRSLGHDQVRFRYLNVSDLPPSDPDTMDSYTPASLGFQRLASGGFVSITTGTPASLMDNSSAFTNSLPKRDVVLPKETLCTTQYHVLELDRTDPTIENKYSCFSNTASLNSYLKGLDTSSAELVIVGTPAGQVSADNTLDTSSIGGTNYTGSATPPLLYFAIGVPGAKAGSAYEGYNAWGDQPYGNAPIASGTLNLDQNGNYNFLPGDNRPFSVVPNDPDKGTYVQIGGQIHRAPQGAANGFWLLQLEGTLLQPTDSATSSVSTCKYAVAETQGCGQFFSTGTSTPNFLVVQSQLGQAIKNANPRALCILTTVGKPMSFQATTGLVNALKANGAAGYTLNSLTSSDSAYTFVFHNVSGTAATATARNRATLGTTSVPAATPFRNGIAISSSSYAQQGQTGALYGYLGRQHDSTFAPIASSQKPVGNFYTPDLSLLGIAGQARVDWPLTDTTGHITAYHAISKIFTTRNNLPDSGHASDIRWYYSGYTASVGAAATDFDPNDPISDYRYPGDGHGYTSDDWKDVMTQMWAEVGAVKHVNDYLGDGGIGKLFTSGSNTDPADEVIQAAGTILSGQVQPAASVSMSASDWMALLTNMGGIASSFLGGVDLGAESAMVGVFSGMLSTGNALAPFINGDNQTPPSYMNGFDTTLADLSSSATKYAGNLVSSYDSAVDAILADWSKLSAVADKTQNSNWVIPNKVNAENLATLVKIGMKRSLYVQLMPQVYGLDTFTQTPVQDSSYVSKVGMYDQQTPQHSTGITEICKQIPSYGSLLSTSWSYAIFPSPSYVGKYDFYVIGGTISHQGEENVTEAMPSEDLLTNLFGPKGENDENLNIPQDLIYGSNVLQSRTGPNVGLGACYVNPCSHVIPPFGKAGACQGF